MVSFPSSTARRAFIDQLATDVSQLGFEWEQQILEREAKERLRADRAGDNPYDFLFHFDSPDNLYYRWRVYSLTHGGSLTQWTTQPFAMTPHGPQWIPPPLPSAPGEPPPSTDALADSLSPTEVATLTSLLSPPQLSLERRSILRVMGFCLEHSAAAASIVRFLCSRLQGCTAPSQSVERVSLLYVLSDCLYNSSAAVRSASAWRRAVEAASGGEVVEAMKRWSGKGVGRAERERVITVLRAWEAWSLFDTATCAAWEKAVRPPASPPVNAGGGEGSGGQDAALTSKRSSAPLTTPLASVDDDVDGVPLL